MRCSPQGSFTTITTFSKIVGQIWFTIQISFLDMQKLLISSVSHLLSFCCHYALINYPVLLSKFVCLGFLRTYDDIRRFRIREKI